jgi:thiamine-phosphate pyrophosphorylase
LSSDRANGNLLFVSLARVPQSFTPVASPLFKIYLITDRKLAAARGGLLAMTAAALAAASPGTVALQLREKDLDARGLVELARQLRPICDQYHTPLIVNDRIDVAIAARADGVHLPANSYKVADARALLDPRSLIGVSTHDPAEVTAASAAGADFVVFGPIFDPLSKGSYTDARGAEGLVAACRAAPIPIFALGGITAARVRELNAKTTGANALSTAAHMSPARNSPAAEGRNGISFAGVAVIGTVFGTADPAAAMRELLDALAQ